ncbi:MAG: hypothetical protein H7196_03125 [candidate division SR1 bacterium]|nr:hypothetical protein [candidate division SR1 bacterium]
MEDKITAKQEFSKLTIVLLFIIIFILLAGTFATIYFTSSQTKQYDKLVVDLKTEISNQKNEKNTIRSIWLDQVNESDKLVTSQENVINQLKNYNLELANTFKFVDKKPQILPTANEERLKRISDQLNLEIKNLQDTATENKKIKNKNKSIIDNMYLNNGELQSNTTK